MQDESSRNVEEIRKSSFRPNKSGDLLRSLIVDNIRNLRTKSTIVRSSVFSRVDREGKRSYFGVLIIVDSKEKFKNKKRPSNKSRISIRPGAFSTINFTQQNSKPRKSNLLSIDMDQGRLGVSVVRFNPPLNLYSDER